MRVSSVPVALVFYLKRSRPRCLSSKAIIGELSIDSGPPQDSSLFFKKPRDLPPKAVLRCMGGDLSAAVSIASRRPRTFGVLSVDR